jgi:hypothetical protein
VLLERLKCHFLLKEFNPCLKDMERMLELGSKEIKYDYFCLDSLKEARRGGQENFL